MRAALVTRLDGPSAVEVTDVPATAAADGQVLVDVRAVGISFPDLLLSKGEYQVRPDLPFPLGVDFAGVVREAPEGSGFGSGDRVACVLPYGGAMETVAVHPEGVFPLPDALTFEQGAAIPVNYSTAWAALLGYGSLREGERVLIHAAAGGVGIAAIQIAKRHGAVVHGTASAHKHDRIRALGADEAHDYRHAGWDRGLDGTFDLVLDAVGGASVRRSYALLRTGGRVVAYGASSLQTGEKRNLPRMLPQALRMWRGFDLISQMSDSKSVIGLNMLRLWEDRRTLEPWLTPLQPLIDDGTVDPVVAEAVPFDRAADAHRLIAERRNVGKVVLVP